MSFVIKEKFKVSILASLEIESKQYHKTQCSNTVKFSVVVKYRNRYKLCMEIIYISGLRMYCCLKTFSFLVSLIVCYTKRVYVIMLLAISSFYFVR